MSHTERFNEGSEVEASPRQFDASLAQPRPEFSIAVLFNPAGREAARSLSLCHDTEAAATPRVTSNKTKSADLCG